MTRFVRRLAAGVAVALVPMAAVTVAAAGVGSAECDPNWSHISRDQRVQTATAAASVVDTSAGVCADIRAAVGAAAPSTAAVGAVAPPFTRYGTGVISSGSGWGPNRAYRLALGH